MQGVAARVTVQPRDRSRRERPTGDVCGQLGGRGGLQRREHELPARAFARAQQPLREPLEPVGTQGDEREQRAGSEPAGGEVERPRRRVVGPLGVVHEQHGWPSGLEHRRQSRRQPRTCREWVDRRPAPGLVEQRLEEPEVDVDLVGISRGA